MTITYKSAKGFSAQTSYINQLLVFQLLITIATGLFAIWGTNTYINAQIQQPTCPPYKAL